MKASLVLLLLAALVFVVRSEGYICTPYDPYTRDTACSGTDCTYKGLQFCLSFISPPKQHGIYLNGEVPEAV
jgi:hypothetical protein